MAQENEDSRALALASAKHWESLADREDEMTRWRIENGLQHLVCPSSAHRASMYRHAANRLRREAEDGIRRCGCRNAIHPIATCPVLNKHR